MATLIKHPIITPAVLEKAMDYTTYRSMINELFEAGKTTGTNHSEAMLNYTKMNIQRMKRLDKTIKLNEAEADFIKNINRPQIWLTISEAWCGDAAYVLPTLNQLAELNDGITLKIILRDEHLDIMDKYLTNGGRSIPKIIVLDAETHEEIATWGPRPADIQQLYYDMKNDPDADKSQIKTEIQRRYIKDKTVSIQKEFTAILQ